jgi:hypothetical protein
MARASGSALQEVVVTATRKATVGNLGDYKLYTLPEPTTVAAMQTKQVAFLEQPSARYERIYTYVANASYWDTKPDEAIPTRILLRLQNKAGQGLGKPLPGGVVTVLDRGPGGPVYAGQARIRDSAIGAPLKIEPGESYLVTVAVKQGDKTVQTHDGREMIRSEVTLTLRNGSDVRAPVEVKLEQSDLKFIAESRRHEKDGSAALWRVDVPPGGEQTLRYVTEER